MLFRQKEKKNKRPTLRIQNHEDQIHEGKPSYMKK
jgi:hypothetical protein